MPRRRFYDMPSLAVQGGLDHFWNAARYPRSHPPPTERPQHPPSATDRRSRQVFSGRQSVAEARRAQAGCRWSDQCLLGGRRRFRSRRRNPVRRDRLSRHGASARRDARLICALGYMSRTRLSFLPPDLLGSISPRSRSIPAARQGSDTRHGVNKPRDQELLRVAGCRVRFECLMMQPSAATDAR
jgi:hypothetical protein